MRFAGLSFRAQAAVAVVAAACLPALAGPEHRLVTLGNEAFARAEYDAAAGLYQEALDKAPKFAEAAYNRACALVALEQFELVPDLLRNADLHAPSDEARGRARFNLGSAFYRSGQAITPENPREAINRFRAAAAAFKAAVRVNPHDDEARKALELSRRAIKLIEDQLAMPQNLRDLANQQRQQGQNQQGEQGEGQEEQGQPGEGQQGQRGERGPQGESPGQGSARDRAQEMRETIEQARQQGVQTDPQNQPGAEQDIREAEEAMRGGNTEDAARELEEAAAKLDQQQQQQQNQQQSGDQQRGQEGQSGDQPAEEGPEGNPVDHVIRQLLEKERQERERRMQYLNPRRPVRARVDKDW